METAFDKQTFSRKLKSMLKVDFTRLFTTPLAYISTGVSLLLPVLILVMTTMSGGSADEATMTFTDVWQSIGAVSGTATGMDPTSLCTINLLYFLTAVMVCLFVGDDFKSGYAKNLFTVRAKKTDYVVSKSLVTFVGAVLLFAAYFVGAMLGGAIAGLSFSMTGFTAGGLIACLVSKVFIIAVFVAIALLFAVVAKQREWLSILCSLAAGMLLFMMIPVMTPLDAGFLNVLLSAAGGALFAAGLGAVSNAILNKTDLA